MEGKLSILDFYAASPAVALSVSKEEPPASKSGMQHDLGADPGGKAASFQAYREGQTYSAEKNPSACTTPEGLIQARPADGNPTTAGDKSGK